MVVERTLTVFSPSGLCNRLKVLASGLALAETSGRRFKMLWPLTPACAAPFAALFCNDLEVSTVTRDEIQGLPLIPGWLGIPPDILIQDEPDLVIGLSSQLVRPDLYPAHAALQECCLEKFIQLQPVPGIQAQVEAFQQQNFKTSMIGVHLRRGDFVRFRPDVSGNLEQALQAVDHFLERLPDAGILLCSDENPQAPGAEVHRRFATRYGSRLAPRQPSSLDRASVEGIQQALVDLWLLRATDAFVGTAGSTFSDTATWGRKVPHRLTAAPTSSYHRLERLARLTGVYALLRLLGRRQIGQEIPFPALLRYFRRSLKRSLGKSPGSQGARR